MLVDQSLTLPRHLYNMNSPEFLQPPLQGSCQSGILESKGTFDRIRFDFQMSLRGGLSWTEFLQV